MKKEESDEDKWLKVARNVFESDERVLREAKELLPKEMYEKVVKKLKTGK